MTLTKSKVMIVLSIAAAVFILLQFYMMMEADTTHPITAARKKSRAYETVREFLETCDSHHIDMIIVDPFIIEELLQEDKTMAGRPCRFLCKNHVYTFAMPESFYMQLKMDVLPLYNQNNFNIKLTYYENHKDEMPTHLLLRDHDHHAIHIVILHDRKDYWWYGPDVDDNLGLHFTKHEGALDKFEYPKVGLDGLMLAMPMYPKAFLHEYRNSRFIPCNTTRSQEFYEKFGPRDVGKNATEFRKAAVDSLGLIKTKLYHLQVPFWLSSGTCLGWFRQCDLIPYTTDVDLGIFIKDRRADLLNIFRQSGYHLEHKLGKVDDSLQYAFDMGKVKVDFFFFYEDGDIMWNGATQVSSGKKFRYEFPKFTLCWTEFMEMKVRVPCETEQYIMANYGPTWFKPIKQWDWMKSPNNVIEVQSWDDDELDEVVQVYNAKGKRIHLEYERYEEKKELK